MGKFLSLCLIVKNEEKVLRRCLDSANEIVDEIIIVDTGSEDKTKSIALEYTNLVYDFEWSDDFSKARNYAASKATGEWIIVLDADEYVDRQSFEKFKSDLKKETSNNILGVQIVSFIGENGQSTSLNYHDRVYKNNGSIIYYRSIHEMLMHKESLEKRGIAELKIFHTGYLENIVREKKKSERNLRLLKRKKQKESVDFFFLGNEYLAKGNFNEAINNYKTAYQLKESIYYEWVPRLIVRLVNCLISTKRFDEALNVTKDAEMVFPKIVDFKYLKGKIYKIFKDDYKAIKILEEIIERKDELKPFSSLDYLEYYPHKTLGELYESTSQVQLAVHHYSKALSVNNLDDYIWIRLISLLAKYSTLEELTEFIKLNCLKHKAMYPQRLINILLKVPNLNVQKQSLLLLNKNQLSSFEYEAVLIKNLFLDKKTDEVLERIYGKNPNEFYKILSSNIFSITDLILLTLDTKDQEFKKILFKIKFDNNMNNLLNLLFSKKRKKLSQFEESLFIRIIEQAYIMNNKMLIEILNNKKEFLSLESKTKIREEIENQLGDVFRDNSEMINNDGDIKEQIISLLTYNHYNDALLLVNQSLGRINNNADLYSIKAVILMKQKNYDDAIEVLKQALIIDPRHVDCLYNMAFIYEQTNQLNLAVDLYKRVSHLTSEDELLEEVNEKIIQLERPSEKINHIGNNVNSSFSFMNENAMSVKNVLYLGWLGKGNVGDDVLFELFKTMFYKYGHYTNHNTVANIDAYPTVQNYKIDISNYDLIVLGGGSLIHLPYWLKICVQGIESGIPVVSWGTGLDGAYKKEHLNSVSLGDQDESHFRAIYEHFDYISVRGPFTKNMLTNIGVNRKVYEIGDPALAYASEIFGDQLEIDENSRNVLVNWGTSYNNVFGRNELAVEDELVVVIHSLISKGYTVTVYPIWTEDIAHVRRLAQKVNDNRCEVITEVYEAKILQKLISKSYLSINFKLHANILSASANRPFISLAYRGKCFDFAQTVNCSEYAIATDEVTSTKVMDLVDEINMNYEDIVGRFKDAKEKYYPKLVDSIYKISNLLNNSEGSNML
ncbi:polysaccharide pyruvyl transferase family protein [Fredinandcohnia sp. 179-A 10B2 NHS]|uniref:polysaccharide pyruvyl transferase family protein n=1 Tax=Fredinandcohnia sp. 179-A 10B2 NHS TaxID=3235176 RepID=UPI0039A223B0